MTSTIPIKHILTLAALLLAPLAALHAVESKPSKPNIILIMADDLGYECVTANGGQSYQTPHLDQLAAAGMRFEQCHVQPLCTPTRAQLMTGRYNVRNYLNFGTLVRTETTFGHLLKQAGYVTGICGKWQLGDEKDSPQHFGFDESLLWQQTRRPPRYANPGLELNGEEKEYPEGSYGPKLINDFALDFVTRHSRAERDSVPQAARRAGAEAPSNEAPFFLYYPMILTHNPFQPTPDSPDWDPTTRGENRLQKKNHFADMVTYMDKMVARLDAKLGELGIRDNTLLIFLGDNGTNKDIASRFNSVEYSGGKGTTTHRGTHVPLIASWPAVIKQPRVNRDLISSTDFLPTLCAAAGVTVPANVDGVSFLPQVRGEKGTPREWLYTWYSPRQSADLTVREYAFDQRFKLYRTGQFFDLATDPEEKAALPSAQLEGEAATAAKKLQDALAQFKDARPTELDRIFEQSARENPREKKKKNAR